MCLTENGREIEHRGTISLDLFNWTQKSTPANVSRERIQNCKDPTEWELVQGSSYFVREQVILHLMHPHSDLPLAGR